MRPTCPSVPKPPRDRSALPRTVVGERGIGLTRHFKEAMLAQQHDSSTEGPQPAESGSFSLTTHTFKTLDTGIGQEAGYESDEALLAAVEAERAALPPEVREAVESLEADIQRRMLGL